MNLVRAASAKPLRPGAVQAPGPLPRTRERTASMTRHAGSRGLTLVELLVAMAIIAFISIMIFQAMDGMRRSKEGVERVADRFREGRMAMARISRELQSAYLSAHAPIDQSLIVSKTIFRAEPGSPGARLDFTSFSHRRLKFGALESDQEEISYFASEDPDRPGVTDLARRTSAIVDDTPEEGGRVDVLATDIDLFDLEFLDPLTGQWREEWDSTSVVEEQGRLPLVVKVVLVLNDGVRSHADSARGRIRLVTKVRLPIQDVLSFALK